jgi:hypothetical protein
MKTLSECIVDSHHGIYAGQVLAQSLNLVEWGVKEEDINILKAGPEQEYYDEVLSDVLCEASKMLPDGRTVTLEQDCDIFIVSFEAPVGFEIHMLPTWIICPLVNDDWSGLEADEEKQLRNWLKRNPLDITGVSEDEEFCRDHDGPGLAGTCVECLVRVSASAREETLNKFNRLRLTHATVNQILSRGGSAEDCAIALAAIVDQQNKRIIELMQIAPRKITTPEGKVMIWRCPDEFVPNMNA